MTLKKLFQILLGIQIALGAGLAVLAVLLFLNQRDLQRSQDTHFNSYLLADELRQSSDDLTRLARTYVATGNEDFERQYWTVLDIRNGKSPRPVEYHRIYWDFVAETGRNPRPDGAAISLHELMVKEGVAKSEIERLTLAQHCSDALVDTEMIAMNAVKGLFDDGTGKFTVKKEPDQALAIRLLHDEAYHQKKAAIMKPIDDFYIQLAGRTTGNVARHERRSMMLLLALGMLILAIMGMFAFAFVVIQRQIGEHLRLETTLAQSAQEWQTTFDASGDAIFLLDKNQRIVRTNKTADQLFHYPDGGAIGRHCWEIVHGTTEPFPECPVQRAQTSLHRETMELQTGGRCYQVTADPVLDAQGQYTGAVHLVSDITDRKRTDQQLRESEERHRAILETAMDGVWAVDMEGRLLEVNAAYSRMSGYTRQELLTMHVSDLEAVETAAATAAHLREVVAQGEDRFESRHRRKDGSTFDVEISVQHRATQGGQLITFLHDIEKRRRTEERLRTLLAESDRARLAMVGILEDETRAKAELKRLAMAIEQSAESIVITDTQGVIQYVNPTFESVTGWTRAEIVGQNTQVLKSGEKDAAFYRSLWDTISNGKIWTGRFISRKKNGELYTEDASISPVLDTTGKIVNYVAVKRDLTGMLSVQAQLAQAQKMESVGRLAGGVAHDFNNMLMGIMGYADLCRDGLPADHPVASYLAEIIRISQRSAELTQKLLAFARKQIIAPKILNLNDATTGTLNLMQRLIGENIRMVWRPAANLWPVKIDPSQVDQILTNLCINARDAIAGVGQLTIETANGELDQAFCANHAGSTPGDYVLLEISDNGCGMDKTVLDHIFEPFFTTKESGKGTGLGLATVYGIIKQNNGSIDVYSEPGRGTTFKIYLPRYTGAPDPSSDDDRIEVPRGRGETVLLVEDDPALRKTCGLFLESLGYKILSAESPAEALDQVARHPDAIQLLLTDMIMPGMNGRQLAEKLLKILPDIKVLYMSGYTADVIAQQGLLDKDKNFIQKPATRDELALKIHRALKASGGATI